MKKEPQIGEFMDDEERELYELTESDDYEPVSIMTPELLAQHRAAARNTIDEASTKISLRISQSDLARVKARALREGIPYQTLIKSIIHQAVS